MAEQEMADKTEAMAAKLAAAAISADIEALASDGHDDLSQPSAEFQPQIDAVSDTADATDAAATTYLKIKELRTISRARSLRLQPEDIIVAIDGDPFHKDIDSFLDIMFECDPENGKTLTIWRNSILFNVIARGPLGCVLEHANSELSEKATEDFKTYTVDPIETYATFEVLRDIFRNCSFCSIHHDGDDFPAVADPEPSVEVLIATFLIYKVDLAVHWLLFVIAYVVLGICSRRIWCCGAFQRARTYLAGGCRRIEPSGCVCGSKRLCS